MDQRAKDISNVLAIELRSIAKRQQILASGQSLSPTQLRNQQRLKFAHEEMRADWFALLEISLRFSRKQSRRTDNRDVNDFIWKYRHLGYVPNSNWNLTQKEE